MLRSHLYSLLTFGKMQELTSDEVREIESGYLWLDWLSIPQITVRRSGEDPDMGTDVKMAVDSIPAYVDAADIFVVLCPSLQHHNTLEPCHRGSWARRGWCRLELAAAAFSQHRHHHVMVVQSTSSVFFMFPSGYLHSPPGEGNFSVEADRMAVFPVMKEIIDHHVESLWQQGPEHFVRAQLFTATRRKLLAGLGTPEQQELLRPASDDETLEQLLQRFHFHGYSSPGRLTLEI